MPSHHASDLDVPPNPAPLSGAEGGVGLASSTGYLLILLAAVLWAMIGPFTSALLDEGIAPLEIAFWRAVIGGAGFVVHGRLVREAAREPLSVARAVPLIALGVVGVGVFYAAVPLAVEAGGISIAVVLLYTAPVWVVIGARLFLGESLTQRKIVLTAVSIAGVVLVSQGQGEGVQVSPAALLWGLVAGITYACWFVAGKRLLARMTPRQLSSWILPVGALTLLPFVDFSGKSARAWLLLVGIGLVSTYAPVLAYYTGLRVVEASRASLVATIEPVIALTIAALVFGERLNLAGVVGAVLVVTAAILASLPARRPRDRRAGRDQPVG